MGVDIQTYRCRIGTFNCRRLSLAASVPSSSGSSSVIASGLLGAVLAQSAELLLLLLLLAGDVELNPGPPVQSAQRKRGRPTGKTCAVPNCVNKRATRADISYFHFPLSW